MAMPMPISSSRSLNSFLAGDLSKLKGHSPVGLNLVNKVGVAIFPKHTML